MPARRAAVVSSSVRLEDWRIVSDAIVRDALDEDVATQAVSAAMEDLRKRIEATEPQRGEASAHQGDRDEAERAGESSGMRDASLVAGSA
jgi:hypothetical protein